MKFTMLIAVAGFFSFLAVSSVYGHDAPTPLMHWDFQEKFIKSHVINSQKGPKLTLPKGVTARDTAGIQSLVNPGKSAWMASEKLRADQLPQRDLSINAWVSVDKPIAYGGIVGYFQDNGSAESGWILGYDKNHFYIALSSQGAKRMTYLKTKTNYVPGKLYYVSATYDGKELAIYLNGKLEATSKEQSGDIHYPKEARLAVAGYVDANENFPHTGTLREIYVYDLAATAKGVAHVFDHGKKLLAAAPTKVNNFKHEAPPFLQMATTTSMDVNMATNEPSVATLYWGETADCKNVMPVSSEKKIHHFTIDGLKPDTQYFYRTTAKNAAGAVLETTVSTFETAPEKDSPIAFAIISDTQGNPKVSTMMAKYAWAQRPDFLVIPGDLTSTGTNHAHWTEQFFPSMELLIKRVPFYPVLGNHEQNAQYYYDYMHLPEPEYYYTFHYGPAQFFMIDSNKKCGPGSEQYVWLEKQLKASKASWKFIVHHHPVYSSDANDYGDLWKTNQSSRGDKNVRSMSVLYDKYGVDVVLNGHIHSYERTWQVKNGKVVETGGVQYFVTGGGGGPLEEAGPSRPPFQNTVKHGHHYSMVRINGNTLEFQAYDIDNKLFDTVRYTRKK